MDISHFGPHIQNIENALENTKYLCNQTRIVEIDAECQNMLQPLVARFQDMSREFASISHLLDNRTKRSAWIGGMGTILKQVFGSLDENDGLRYDEAIESLQNNEKQLASLLKENILVTTSAITSFNSTLRKIKDNEANLKEAIDKLSLSVINISDITNGLKLLANINEIFDILETSILTLSFQLEDVINAILFSSKNILHPSIITPSQLHQELVDNYRYLPSDLELPTSLDINSVHLILDISKLVCYYFNYKIIFVLQVPLVNTREYILFHNIALPTPYKPEEPNSFGLILPDNRYIAMTKDKSYYSVFDNLEICKSVSPGDFICDIENVYSTDAKPTCESELLAKVINEKPIQCETKILLGTLDIWKPIINNRWIFIQSEPTKISIDCVNSKLYETNILGAGILSIPKGCIGYCKSTTLIPKFTSFINITSPINNIPDFNLINDTCCNLVKLENVKDDVSPVYLKNIDLDDFNSANAIKLKSLLSNLNNLEDQQFPHIIKYGTHYSISIILILVLIFISLFYYTFKKTCNSGSNRPFLHKFSISKPPSQSIQEITDITDRPDPEIELTSPRTRTRV